MGRLDRRVIPAMPRRLPRLSFYSLVACVPVVGMCLAFSPPAGASTASAHSRAVAAAIAALKQLRVGDQATNHATGRAVKINGLTQVQSTNWSGYADDNTAGNTYSTVTGSWSEPAVSCPSRGTLDAVFWVGIDGFTSGSVEQDGTLAQCSHGKASYFTWWEMFPTNSIQAVGSSVSPGDSISASVVRSGTTYTLKVTDSTHPANSFSTSQTCSNCANSSAEWIAEAPSSGGKILPLANFGTWSETGSTVNSGGISSFPDDELTMVDNSGSVKAQPGPLSGSGFTVTWKSST
jgi:peptidase A4-like protein